MLVFHLPGDKKVTKKYYPAQSASHHLGIGHIYYSTRYLVLNSISDNKQLVVLCANDPPLVVA